MDNKLVFIHIEKSAGSSQRAWLLEQFGINNIYWHKEEFGSLGSATVLGGHLRFNQFEYSKSNLYLSIVREPIDRVISLYNYQINKNLEHWIQHGIDPNSFKNTLFNCKNFRRMIKSGQCRYISESESVTDTITHISQNNFLIGCIQEVDRFNERLTSKLQLKNIKLQRANTGEQDYKSKIEYDAECIDELKILLEEDYKLYDYITDEHNGLFCNVTDEVWESLKQKVASLHIN